MNQILLCGDSHQSDSIVRMILVNISIDVHFTTEIRSIKQLFNDHSFELVVIEISCEETIRKFIRVIRVLSTCPILLVSSLAQSKLIGLYGDGISDHMTNPITPSFLRSKISIWLKYSHNCYYATNFSEKAIGDFQYDFRQRKLYLSEVCIPLSFLENRLISLFLSNPHQIFDSYTVAQHLWGYSDSEHLVKNIIYRLRKKIEPVPSEPRYIITQNREGYFFVPE